MVAVGYRRESSAQAEVDQAYQYQLERLEEYGCAWVFGDRVSGRKSDRQGYKQALAKIENGEADELVVTHLFRLGRSVIECCRVIDFLKKKNSRLTILGGSVNTKTPEGRASLNFQMVMGQLEAELGQERSRISWQNSTNKARPRSPVFGYRIEEGFYVPDENKMPIAVATIEKALELRSLSATVRWVIAEYADIIKTAEKRTEYPPTSKAGLGRWLLNPILQGHLFLGDRKFYNRHTPIIGAGQVLQIEEFVKYNREHHEFKRAQAKLLL